MENPSKQKFINYRNIGRGGINVFDNPQDILDVEVVDAENMIFDSSAEVRPGSSLKWDKPVGETNDLLCLFDARTSDGLQYVIAVYAPNFYFRDEVNNQWIKINQSYTPSVTNISLMYSYINWNAGRSADSIYACNGTDSFIKWAVGFSTVSTAVVIGATTIVVSDASYFPATGTLVVKESGGTAYSFPYTSISTNTITLTTSSLYAVAVGAGVVLEIVEKASMAKGKVLARHQRRLFVANYYGGESNIKYSKIELPEDFTTGTGVTLGGALTISDGNGGITLMSDFGTYLIVSKEDNIVKFDLKLNASLDAKLDEITPITSDKSMGPINVWSTIKKNKSIYYPTATEGILILNPEATGNATTIGVNVKSKKIQTLYKKLNFTNSRTTTFDNKIIWSCASNSSNDTVLVYDTLRDYWTKFNNWNVKDWSLHNSELLFASRIDNNIYQAFTKNNYTDNDDPYTSSLTSKNYNFGEPSLPKTCMYMYVQGNISSTTTLYFNITIEQGNRIVTSYYSISGTGSFVGTVIPEALAMTMLGTSIMGMGSTLDLDNRGIYRAYLAIPIRNGFYTINFKASSKKTGDYWSIEGVSFNPELVTQVSTGMVTGVIGVSNPTNSTIVPITSLSVKGGVVRVIDSATGNIARTTSGWIEDEKYGMYAFAVTASVSAVFDSSVIRTGILTLKFSTTDINGSGQVKISNVQNADTVASIYKYGIPVKSSTSYRFTCYAKTTNVVTDSVKVDLNQYSATAGVNTLTTTNTLSGTQDWTALTSTFTTDATTVFIILGFKNITAGNISDVWFDINSMTLEQVYSITNSSSTNALFYPLLTAVTSTNNIDQSQVNSPNSQGFGDAAGGHQKIANSFTPTKKNITGVTFQIKTGVGTYVGNVIVSLQADSAGSPSGVILSSVTITNANWAAISLSTDYSVSFSYTVTTGNQYWVVFDSSTQDASNYPQIAKEAGSTSGRKSFNGTIWGANTGQIYFKTLYSKNTTNFTVSTDTETISVTSSTANGYPNATIVDFTSTVTLTPGANNIYVSSNGPSTADGTVDPSLQGTLEGNYVY